MDLIQFIVLLIGLAGLYWYQHYRIKQLEGKTKDQSKLLQDIKTYFDIINPELMKYRVELFEHTLEKEKKIEIDQIKTELERAIEAERGKKDYTGEIAKDLVNIIADALFFIPHEGRKKLVAKAESDRVGHYLEQVLPVYQELEERFEHEMIVRYLLKGPENKGEANPRN